MADDSDDDPELAGDPDRDQLRRAVYRAAAAAGAYARGDRSPKTYEEFAAAVLDALDEDTLYAVAVNTRAAEVAVKSLRLGLPEADALVAVAVWGLRVATPAGRRYRIDDPHGRFPAPGIGSEHPSPREAVAALARALAALTPEEQCRVMTGP